MQTNPQQTIPTWASNLGLDANELHFGVILIVLVIMVAFGGVFGQIGWYGLLLMGLVTVLAAFAKKGGTSGT